MPSQLWPYITPGIPDDLFERLPGIPLSEREIRLLLIAQLRLKPDIEAHSPIGENTQQLKEATMAAVEHPVSLQSSVANQV